MGRGLGPVGMAHTIYKRTRGGRPPMTASQIPASPPPPRQTRNSSVYGPAFGVGTSPSLPRETAKQQTRGGRPPAFGAAIGGRERPSPSLQSHVRQQTRGGRPPAAAATRGGRGGREFLKQFFRSGRR